MLSKVFGCWVEEINEYTALSLLWHKVKIFHSTTALSHELDPLAEANALV